MFPLSKKLHSWEKYGNDILIIKLKGTRKMYAYSYLGVVSVFAGVCKAEKNIDLIVYDMASLP